MYIFEVSTRVRYPLEDARWRGENGGHLDLTPGPGLSRADIDGTVRSVWRYAKALRVPRQHAVSMGEGWTPLVQRSWHGASIQCKLEFMMPTGSFKDRGMTVMVSYLKSRGIDHVLEDSSGNAGASLSAYAAAAGMRCRILVPQTASYPKIAQIAACGADVVTIRGTRQDVADAAVRYSSEIFYASHNWQPFFIEGTKTLAYELWEQYGFDVPDNIIVPLGYGSNVMGCYRGFEELIACGAIKRMPRLFGIQAANCAPFANAYAAGVETLVPTDIKPTIAEGIASSVPTRVPDVLQAARKSGGGIVAVTEEEIVTALRTLAQAGLYVEPTSAAAGAGLTRLLENGTVKPGDNTVLVLTGTGLKSSEAIGKLLGVGAREE